MRIQRHSLLVRITHWTNAAILLVMVLSGLQIFNAHPALYLGQKSTFDRPLIAITSVVRNDGAITGETLVFGATFETTGVLGASKSASGREARAFPSWLTLPTYRDLAAGRRWHFFFAWLFVVNGAFYLVHGVLTRHFARDLWPSSAQLKHLGREIISHARLRFPRGEDARHYNGIQKLAYLSVIVVLAPIIVATGMTMSPGLNAALPWLVDVFGGRQTARTIHFFCALGLVAFVLVHLLMVLVSGVWNNLRSMITGAYELGEAK